MLRAKLRVSDTMTAIVEDIEVTVYTTFSMVDTVVA